MSPPGSQSPSIVPQFYPVEYHSEFGYLAPAMSLRHKVSLLAKGAVFGVLVGAVAAVTLSPDREARVRSAFHMQTQAAPGDELAPLPVRFVAPTLAMGATTTPVDDSVPPAPAPTVAAAPVATPPEPTAPAAVPVSTPPAQTTPAPPREQKPAAKPKKKIARQPPRQRSTRATEPRPRNTRASEFRRASEPERGASFGSPFGFGW